VDMAGRVEMVLTYDRTEQATTENANSEDRGHQQASDEASVCGNGKVSECSGLGPSVAIVFSFWSAQDLASAVKRLNNKIRITLALPSESLCIYTCM